MATCKGVPESAKTPIAVSVHLETLVMNVTSLRWSGPSKEEEVEVEVETAWQRWALFSMRMLCHKLRQMIADGGGDVHENVRTQGNEHPRNRHSEVRHILASLVLFRAVLEMTLRDANMTWLQVTTSIRIHHLCDVLHLL
jgi:site-specific recombinase XerC